MNTTSSIAPSAERLKGKVAIITGGASGFGKSTARLFVQHGAKVVIADIQDDLGISLCAEIDDGGGDLITYIHCDVSNEDDVRNLIDVTISKHGKVDIMFNNAGIFGDPTMSISQTTNENFKAVFETNVYGGFLGAKQAARVMVPRKSGVILFTASVASEVAGETPHGYTVSKYAIVGLMKNLCVEMGQHGIRVNAISPCLVSTPFGMNGSGGVEKSTLDGLIVKANVLKGVTPEPLDVANLALFLASDEAKYATGVNFCLDGGYNVTNPSFSITLNNFFAPN